MPSLVCKNGKLDYIISISYIRKLRLSRGIAKIDDEIKILT